MKVRSPFPFPFLFRRSKRDAFLPPSPSSSSSLLPLLPSLPRPILLILTQPFLPSSSIPSGRAKDARREEARDEDGLLGDVGLSSIVEPMLR